MKSFEEFIRNGWIKKRRKDPARAKSVVEEAEKRLAYYKKQKIDDESANYIIENVYDVIREFVEARMLLDGYKTYSHEAIISYLKVLGFPDFEIKFLNELREIRHNTKYYGSIVDEDYAKRVFEFFNTIYGRLKELVKI